jgi:hypothetical protein
VNSKLVMVLVPMFFCLQACDSGGGGGPASRVVPRDYDKIACKNQAPDQGKNALFQNKNMTEFVMGFFNKPYDRHDLEAVLDASSVSTTDYVKSLGVELFRVPRTQLAGACQTFFNLDEAAEELKTVWNRASGGVSDGRLAGLYWDNCGDSCQDFAIVRPTILVDEASDRWTLVHELMHHNFNQARKADRGIIPYTPLVRGLQRSINKIEKLMREHQLRPELSKLEAITTEAETVNRSLFELEKRGSFEEVALEAQLILEWYQGRFTSGNIQSAQSSLWYMDTTRKQGLASFDDVTTVLNFVKAEAKKNTWAIPSAVPRIEAAIEQINAETLQVLVDARKRVDEKSKKLGKPLGFFKLPAGSLEHLHAHMNQREGAAALREFRLKMETLRSEFPELN